jgi:epoxyqueuosine reductase QueG
LVARYIAEKNMGNQNEERKHSEQEVVVERIQTGVRMEKRMVKVLKGLAEYLDLSLGDLLEGIVLHAFVGEAPFSDETLAQIARLKEVYRMDYGVEASHRLQESNSHRKEKEDDTI